MTAALMVVVALWGGAAYAQAAASASVAVRITVAPIAEVEFPSGSGFVIRVPDRGRCQLPRGQHRDQHNDYRSPWDRDCWYGRKDWWWPAILPVRIPFVVNGNARASVSVAPSAFLRVPGNRYLGRALGPRGQQLGYNIVVHFPAPDRGYRWLPDWDDWDDWDDWGRWHGFGNLPRWSTYAMLPGRNGAGTPPLTADMVQRRGQAAGVIYIIARQTWTPDGRVADPGLYSGRVEITVIADNR